MWFEGGRVSSVLNVQSETVMCVFCIAGY